VSAQIVDAVTAKLRVLLRTPSALPHRVIIIIIIIIIVIVIIKSTVTEVVAVQ